MLLKIDVLPGYVLVDSMRMLPRFWVTAWSLGLAIRALAPTTLKLHLRHIDAFYLFVDERFGFDAFDSAVSARDAAAVREMVEIFYVNLTSDPDYTTSHVQRWDVVRGFIQALARMRAPLSDAWSSLSLMLAGFGKLRSPNRGKIRHIRALPVRTLVELLDVARPGFARNPFREPSVQLRNWFIVNLLLMSGLRRGEALLLEEDSLKYDIDIDTGEMVYWLDVTASFDSDPRRTPPSIKTIQSHRQIPISASLAELYFQYLGGGRRCNGDHPYLLTSRSGNPLSAESLTKVFERLTTALSPEALSVFHDRCGKPTISPHDLRHTCATAQYAVLMQHDSNRDLAMQRMRAFFGWSVKSEMPEHYARAAIQEDLTRSWNRLFDDHIAILRGAIK